jgi:membrane protein implicated in regulation of membrane protease activity
MNDILQCVVAAVCVVLLIWMYRTVRKRTTSETDEAEQERLTELLRQHHQSVYQNNIG